MKFLSVFAALCLGIPVYSASQEDSIFETMEVQRYQVQVNVTDRQEQPIRGLSKSNFKVKLNGKLQKVESLDFVDLTVVEPGELITQHARRLFVFLFDFRYTTERGVIAAQKAATQFVKEELLPTDLVAVFAASPLNGLLTVTNFTNDPAHLRQALQSLGLGSARDISRGPAGYYSQGLLVDYFGSVDGRANLGGIFDIADPSEGGRHPVEEGDRPAGIAAGLADLALDTLRDNLLEARKAERRNYAGEVMKFNKELDALARALTYTRGRKNLILFSAGYDSSVLTGLDQRSLMRNAESSLRQENIAFVDTNQLGNSAVMSFANDLIASLQGSGTVVFALDTSKIEEASDVKFGIQSLNSMAMDTGGRVFEHQNDLSKPMHQIKQITNQYYVLTLIPSGKFEEGSLADLKIDVDMPRARVTAQRGLLIRPDFTTLNPLERQIHIADYLSKDLVSYEIPAEIDVMSIPENDGLVRLLVNMEIRGDYFLGESLEEGRDIEYFAMAVNRKTNITFDTVSSQYKLSLGKAREILQETGIKYFTSLLVKPGEYNLKIVVRDLKNGKVGSLIRHMVVSGDLPPVTVVALADVPWVTLYGERANQVGDLDLGYPFKLGTKSFIPKERVQFAKDDKAKFFFLIEQPGDPAEGKTGVKALIQDREGQIRVVPPEAMQADFSGWTESGRAPILLLVDMAQLGLNEGETYKLLTQFELQEGQPVRWMTEFSM